MRRFLTLLLLLGLVASCGYWKHHHKRNAESCMQTFETMDLDKDGKISKQEWKGKCEKKFAMKDINNDGFISKEEYEGVKTRYNCQKKCSCQKQCDGQK